MKHSLEIVRRVYDDGEGVCIEVLPSADNDQWIEVRTDGASSVEYYGKFSFCIPADQARLLGQALIAAADEVTEKK